MTGVVNVFNKHLLEVGPQWLGTKIGKFAKKAIRKGEYGKVTRAGEVLEKAENHIRNMEHNIGGVYNKYFIGTPYRGRGHGTPRKALKNTADEMLVKPKKWVSPLTGKERVIKLNPGDYGY